MSRAAVALLSTDNLLHNLAAIKSHAPSSHVIAMIKANAYGHGLRSTALRLEPYVYSFGVASIDEALALRNVGITLPITLMEGVFEPSELPVAVNENFHVVFHNREQLLWLKIAELQQSSLTAWLKIDTGMGRLGFPIEQAEYAYVELAGSPYIKKPIGILSHFACADTNDHPLNQKQIKKFEHFVKDKKGPKSLCNSAAIFSFKDHHYDMIRPGLALYGASPFQLISAADLGLKPVMTLQTKLMSIKEVKKGSTIGYNARFVCPEDMRIGIIAMGYGDGYPWTARDGTPILINGIRCALIGRVSMDMITVDLRAYPQAHVNDTVILWGDGLPIEEVAQYTQQCPYDILTAVQLRVRFSWT